MAVSLYIFAEKKNTMKKFKVRTLDFEETMGLAAAMPTPEMTLTIYHRELAEREQKILSITGDPISCIDYSWLKDENKKETVESLLSERYRILSEMFELHCSDSEAKRFESLNERLFTLTGDMFSRTGTMYRQILSSPLEEKDDDLTVEGCLRYWGDTAQDVLHLEDDEYYRSDFTRMIIVNALLQQEKLGDMELMTCDPYWDASKGLKPTMSDKELGLENTLDDGTTWAEGWMRNPKLEHICVCYATHALITHSGYSIPDFLRLNTFEVKVTAMIQQISEQDGSRLWWWEKCKERQFTDKFLHEAEHRPSGQSLGEFIWNRCVEYFGLNDMDNVGKLPDCRKDDNQVMAFMHALWQDILKK